MDALYIELKAIAPAEGIDVEGGLTAGLDTDGQVIGIEILHAKKPYGATMAEEDEAES